MEALGQQRMRGAARAGFAEEQELVAGDLLLQRRAALGPVRQQFGERARVHDGAGQDMRARLGALFQDADGQFAAGFDGALAQSDGRGQAGRPGTDDHHVELHGFTRGQGGGLFAHGGRNSWVVPPARGLRRLPGNRARDTAQLLDQMSRVPGRGVYA